MKSYAHKRSFSIIPPVAPHSLVMPPRPHSPFPVPTERDSLLGAQRQEDQKESIPQKQKGGGPDGAFAWFVAFANFLINLIVVGLGRMSGILYVVFMGMYQVDRQTASVPFAVQQAARNLFGPLAGILGQKYGVRIVTVGGGVLGAAATAACFFVTDLNTITLCWGLLFGICTALTTTLNQVPIDQYFEKHRTTAGGLAFSGGCVGAFLFPSLIEALIGHYSMPGTFLVMAALILNVVPAALILKEPSWKKKKVVRFSDDREDRTSKRKRRRKQENAVFEESYQPILHQDTQRPVHNYRTFAVATTSSLDFSFLRENGRLVYQLFTHVLLDDVTLLDAEWSDASPLVKELQDMHDFMITYPTHAAEMKTDPPSPTTTAAESQGPGLSSTDVLKQMILKQPRTHKIEDNPRWIFVACKLRELAEIDENRILLAFPEILHEKARKVLEMLSNLNNLVVKREAEMQGQESPSTAVEIASQERGNHEIKNASPHTNSFSAHLKTALWLHTKPLFLLICICRGVFMLTFIPMVTIVVDFAMDKGLRRTTGQYAIAILSLGDLVGRLCFGWVNDSGLLSLPRYMMLCMVLLGASTASLPLTHNELSLLPAVLVFGALQGSLFVRHQILVSQYMEPHEQTIGMGFINFLSGFIGFGLPYYIGYFRDTMGSYDNMLYLNGGICAAVGLLWTLEPYFNSSSRDRKGYRKMLS